MRSLVAVVVALAAAPSRALQSRAALRQVARAPKTVVQDFGDQFYMGHEYGPPNGAPLAEGVFEVALRRPLGIEFEEVGPAFDPKGVKVIGLVEGGNAAESGAIKVDDELVGVTAVRFRGAKFEREMYDATAWTFDRVVEAISSNEPKWRCEDVVLQFTRPSE